MSRQIFDNSNGLPNDKLSDAFNVCVCFGIFWAATTYAAVRILPRYCQAIKVKLPRSVVSNQYSYWM